MAQLLETPPLAKWNSTLAGVFIVLAFGLIYLDTGLNPEAAFTSSFTRPWVIGIVFVLYTTALGFIDLDFNARLGHRTGYAIAHGHFFSYLVILPFLFYFQNDWMIDDGATVIRYMQHAQQHGQWFAYNLNEGPAWGISGLLWGISSQVVSMLLPNIFPEFLLRLLCIVGFGFLYHGIYWYIATYISEIWLRTACSVLVLLMGHHAVLVFDWGVEAPLQIGLVLITTRLALFSNKPSWQVALWAGLLVLGKLDALPLAVMLILASMYRQDWQNWKRTLWIVLGLIVGYGLLTYGLFGQLIPQTSMAKQHAKHSFGPGAEFLLSYFQRQPKLILGALFTAGLYLLLLCYERWQYVSQSTFGTWLRGLGSYFAPIMIALLYLSIYSVYNPKEQMLWYYALPDILLAIQIIISVYQFLFWLLEQTNNTIDHARWGTLFFVTICLLPASKHMIERFNNQHTFRLTQELQFTRAGDYVKRHSVAGQTAMTQHSYTANATGLKIIDFSGLNQPYALAYNFDLNQMLHQYGPDWVIDHQTFEQRLPENQATYWNQHYILDTALILFYNQTEQRQYFVFKKANNPLASLQYQVLKPFKDTLVIPVVPKAGYALLQALRSDSSSQQVRITVPASGIDTIWRIPQSTAGFGPNKVAQIRLPIPTAATKTQLHLQAAESHQGTVAIQQLLWLP